MADALLKNCYPKWLIRQYSIPREKVAGRVDEQPRATFFLPYVHGVSDALKRVLEPFCIMQNSYETLPDPEAKAGTPKGCCSKNGEVRCIVLHSLCGLSCQLCGETKQRLGKRMEEHRKADWKAVWKAGVEVSALAEHAQKSDHKVDWEQIAFLGYSTD